MWNTSVTADLQFFVKGFLGIADLQVNVDATIAGLTGVAPGSYAITSTNNGVTGTINSMSVNNCVVSASNVNVEVDGTTSSTATTDVTNKINGDGPKLCATVNSKLASGVVGKTIPL